MNLYKLQHTPSATGNFLDKNKEIKSLIADEVEKSFSSVLEELSQIKIKINNLENVNKTKKVVEKERTKKDNTLQVIKTNQNISKPVTPKQKPGPTPNKLEADQRQLMNEIINLDPSNSKNRLVEIENQNKIQEIKNDVGTTNHDEENRNIIEDGSGFIFPKTRRQNQKTVIGQNLNSTKLKAVNPLSWIFVSQLEPDTTVEDVKSYLNDYDIRVMQCFKLKTFSNNITAFKVGVNQSDEDKMFSGDMWPVKTIIRPYTPKEQRNFRRNPSVSLKK